MLSQCWIVLSLLGVLYVSAMPVPEKAAAPQPQPMPNIQYVLSGYNVMFGNPMPTDQLGIDPGFKEQIFEANYTSGTLSADKRWLQPSGLLITNCKGTCNFQFRSTEIAGQKSYQDRLSTQVGVSGSGWGAEFSASTGFKSVAKGSSQRHSFYTQSEIRCCASIAKTQTYNLPPLTTNFKNGLATLTADAPESAYFDFIETFGTHYVKSATLGALFGQQSEITASAWAKMTEDKVDIKAAAGYSGFGVAFNANFSHDSDKEEAEQFAKQTTSQLVYSIGSAPPTDKNELTWANSAIQSPTPMSAQLAQIDTLATGAAAKGLQSALSKYCDYLKGKGTVESCNAPGEDPPFPSPPKPEECVKYGDEVYLISEDMYIGTIDPSVTDNHGLDVYTSQSDSRVKSFKIMPPHGPDVSVHEGDCISSDTAKAKATVQITNPASPDRVEIYSSDANYVYLGEINDGENTRTDSWPKSLWNIEIGPKHSTGPTLTYGTTFALINAARDRPMCLDRSYTRSRFNTDGATTGDSTLLKVVKVK